MDRRIIVMKVGLHLGEAWDSIVGRKMEEERTAGVIHWGYGGSVCHPITQVQPFARESEGPVSVLMIRTRSELFGASVPARAESRDGTTWTPIPTGVVTTGKYALILRDLRATDEQLDLGDYLVGIGPKAGTPLASYLRGRVDKACARLANGSGPASPVTLVLRAELVPPYAVILGT